MGSALPVKIYLVFVGGDRHTAPSPSAWNMDEWDRPFPCFIDLEAAKALADRMIENTDRDMAEILSVDTDDLKASAKVVAQRFRAEEDGETGLWEEP